MKWLLRLVVAMALVVLLAEPSSAFTRGGYTSAPTGNCPQGTADPNDGCTGAQATGVQNSSLLTSYGVNRPSWNVSGDDYPVGIPTTAVLSDPLPIGTLATFFSSTLGCSFNSSTNTIGSCNTTSCANKTVTLWDFSLHNGLRFEAQCNGIIITQNNFKVGSNTIPPLHILAGTNGCTITYNTIDGAGIPTSDGGTGVIGGLLVLNNFGTCTVQYNYIANAYFQTIEKGGDASGSTIQNLKYNWIENAGTGHLPAATFTGAITGVSGGVGTLTISGISGTVGINSQVCSSGSCDVGSYLGYITAFVSGTGGNGTYTVGHATATASSSMAVGGAHGDQVQDITASGQTITSVGYQYNFLRQTGTNSTQGLSIFSAANQTGGQYDGCTVTNNTAIYGASSNSNDAFIIDNTWLNGSCSVNSNFLDITGLNSDWMFWGKLNTPDGPFNGTMSSCVGNTNMVTGTRLTTNGGTSVGCSFLLKRDLDPASNDNDPMWLEKAA